jgi:OmpA-OmpF porin, OOP family
MKKTTFGLVLSLFFVTLPITQAQFIKDLKKRAEEAAKRTVERKTEEKTEQKTEQAIDSLFNVKIKKRNPGDVRDDPNGQAEWSQTEEWGQEGLTSEVGGDSNSSLQAYSKFDFIPGTDILFAADFSNDALGDLPEGWITSSTLEVVELSDFPGKWIQIGKGQNAFTPLDFGPLPQDFTLEFDIILDVDAQKFAPATRQFGVVMNDFETPTIQLSNWRAGNHMVFLGFNASQKSAEKRWKQSQFNELVNSPLDMLSKENLRRGDLIRISVWKNKNRVRMYFNEQKVFDLVQAQAEESPFRSLKFYANNANDGEHFFVSNFRIADAPPVIKSKMEEGIFEATGIYFDPGSAVIRPESFPSLKQIADFMVSNGGSYTIAGHTDNTGDKEQNRLLSEQRASAVRKALVKDFGVDTNQLASIGFGQRYPLYPNDTPEVGPKTDGWTSSIFKWSPTMKSS